MGLGPRGKLRGVLMPMNNGRLVTPVEQLWHRTLVREGPHGVFVRPDRQRPKRQVGVPESRRLHIPSRALRLHAT
jgi:hypothetical protein